MDTRRRKKPSAAATGRQLTDSGGSAHRSPNAWVLPGDLGGAGLLAGWVPGLSNRLGYQYALLSESSGR
jgi:hypothetical protein